MDTTATTTDPLALSISGAPPGSGLADINNNNDNSNGTTNSAPPSSGNIDFTYSDTDVQLKELAELYSYNEELDFTANRTSFEELMEDYGYSLKWTQALPVTSARRAVELVEATARQDEDEEARRLLTQHREPLEDLENADGDDDAFISGQFTCDLCQLAISGGRSYQTHLRSKGHRARQAAETAKRRRANSGGWR